MKGIIRQVNVKPEVPGERGLPKRPAPSVRLTPEGVEGDFNRWRKEKGRGDPTSAVLLMPWEMLEELNREGWPIQPGDLGENLMTTGIAYGSFTPGQTYRVGEAEIQVTRPCDPCKNLYLLPYVGTARGPEFLRATHGRRGWYCRVVRPGVVRPGDAIEERAALA